MSDIRSRELTRHREEYLGGGGLPAGEYVVFAGISVDNCATCIICFKLLYHIHSKAILYLQHGPNRT